MPACEQWQNRLTPVWRRVAGGCHLNRKMDDLIREAGFTIAELQTEYMPGPRLMTYMYEGIAHADDSSRHREADAPAIAAIYAPYCKETRRLVRGSGADRPMRWPRRISGDRPKHPWIVLEKTRRDRRIRLCVAASRTRGLSLVGEHGHLRQPRPSSGGARGARLYTTLFELLRHLGYYRATAGITLPNAASVGLHEAFGFTLVGVYRDIGYKMGAWHDVAWYQTTVQPPSAQPSDPRPIGAIHGSPAWHDAVARGVALYAERA